MGFTADQVPRLRRRAYGYLTGIAPAAWARGIATGMMEFHTPARLANLDPKTRARKLAEAEARRIRHARLFHMDSDATRMIEKAASGVSGQLFALARERISAEYGMLVWERPVAVTSQGLPVIACHWHARDRDVWLTWWTDAAAVRDVVGVDDEDPAAQMADTMMGPLGYEQEKVVPYGVLSPVLEGDQQAGTNQWRMIVATLLSICTEDLGELVSVTRLPAPDLPADPAEMIEAGEGLPVPDADETVTAITFRRRPRWWQGAVRNWWLRRGGKDPLAQQ